MYVRLARFAAVDPAAFGDQVELMRRQVGAVRAATGRSMDDPDEQTMAEFDAVPSGLRETVRRLSVLVDDDEATAVVLVFCTSEDAARDADAALGRLPLPEGVGTRTDVEIYRVALDEDMSLSLATGDFS
jgi:hypothetical protein